MAAADDRTGGTLRGLGLDRLTRVQLDEIGRERQVQRQGALRAEARAELSVELAQARILPAYELGR